MCKEVIVVCVRRREEEEKEPGIQNQKQEPHTKLWGKTQQSPLHHSIIWKRLSGATEWNVYSMVFHFCLIHFDRFMNSTLQPLKSPLLNGFWMPEDAFCEISTVWFQQKNDPLTSYD